MLAPPGEKDGLPVNEAFTLRGHDGPVLGVRFNKAGTYCLSCGKVYHTLTCDAYSLHPTFTAHLPRPTHAWLSHSYTAMQDRAIKLWNPRKGNLIKTYNGVLQHPQAFLPPQLMYIVSCAASRDGCAMQGMAMMSEMLWCPVTTASTPALAMPVPQSAFQAPHFLHRPRRSCKQCVGMIRYMCSSHAEHC